MKIRSLAGKPAPRDLLVDIDKSRKEYYARKPDITDSTQSGLVSAPAVTRAPHCVARSMKRTITKWFEVLKDEQLQELIRTALAQNYDIRDAVARVDAARANLGITQADEYPKFGTGGGFSSIELSREGEFGVRRSIKAHRRSDKHDR